jgi:hemerythrin-like domain-containing protein
MTFSKTLIMTEKPIKRSKHLLLISREHHFGLLFCWKIRQGIKLKIDPTRITRYVQYFWQNQLHAHFKEEEMLIFLDKADTLIQKAQEEHVHIENQIQKILQAANPVTHQQLNGVADAIDNHIRFEERTLFPHLEKIFTEAQLENIGAQLEEPGNAQAKDNYPDEFWVAMSSSL